MEQIVENHIDNDNGKYYHLAAGTALNRTKWASVRQSVILDSNENAESLESVESALFHYWLDEESIPLEGLKKQQGINKLA